MTEDGKVVWSVVASVSGLILVEDDIERPMEVVLDGPMLSGDLPEACRGHWRAQEIIGCFHGRFSGGFAGPDDFADGLEPGPLMIFLEPVDRRGDCRHAGFDAPVIALDSGFGRDLLRSGIIEKSAHVVMQRALITLERQGIVASLIDDLTGDIALTVERIDGHDAAFQREHLQELGDGRNLVRLGVGCDLAEYQTLLAAPGA